MIRISQLKLPAGHSEEEFCSQLLRQLGIPREKLLSWEIQKKSIDARKRPVLYVYTVDVCVEKERQLAKRLRNKNISLCEKKEYVFPKQGDSCLSHPPVIVGSGPAGLFCGLMLARAGYCPILIERGETARKRKETVDAFWAGGKLNPQSNVQFGEGGAGTFSDGKLNTLVKDPFGRGRLVLKTFVEAGAPEEILYENKPHLGTDLLIGVVEKLREEICSLGGQVLFETCMTDVDIQEGAVRGIHLEKREEGEIRRFYLETEALVLAIGHSARDTFQMLFQKQVPMERKAFAVGLRIEHPQEMINKSQYGEAYPSFLPAAAYKLTRKVGQDRGVYSFCMCPGGYVVNASSEVGGLAVNGMSYQARSGPNANSAMIVTVRPEDFGGEGALSGIEFQRKLERAAWKLGDGRVPVQLLSDFCKNRKSRQLGEISPSIKGDWTLANLREIFPENLARALQEGILGCGRILPGFDRPDALLSGVESRTSSPVRILRNGNQESAIRGLYPCGEGAGYAGGITSAAMDGVKTAEAIARIYRPREK